MSTLMKDIPISGLSTSPSGYEAQDGNLAAAIGVVHEAGTIHNASCSAPKLLKNFYANTVIYQHNTFTQNNLICSGSGDKVCWVQIAQDQTVGNSFVNLDEIRFSDVRNIISTGNTLIIYSEDKTYYYLWKNGSYLFLGNQIPNINIQFGLEGETKIYYYKTQETIDNGTNYAPDAESQVNYGDDLGMKLTWKNFDSVPEHMKTSITESVMSRVNKFVSEECDAKGRFCMPFLVRYAYRLFDGSLTMHSSPVLMIPDTDAPIVPIHGVIPDDERIYFHVIGTSAVMNYKVLNYSDVTSKLAKWKDIVTSVEIYISAPFYTYDQSGTIDRVITDGVTITTSEDSPTKIWIQSFAVQNTYWMSKVKEKYAVMAMHDFNEVKNTSAWESNFDATSNTPYRKSIKSFFKDNKMTDEYDSFLVPSEECDQYVRLVKLTDGSYYVSVGSSWDADCVFRDDNDIFKNPCFLFYQMPENSWNKIEKEAQECSNFYLIKEIRIDEITSERKVVRLDDGELKTLTTRPTMSDDYDSHDVKLPKVVTTYNGRLNMANITINKFKGYDFSTMAARQAASSGETSCSGVTYFVSVTSNYGSYVIKNTSSIDSESNGISATNYFYFPEPNATKAVLYFKDTSGTYVKKVELTLHEHLGLNGSVSDVSLKDAPYTTISLSASGVDTDAASSIGYNPNAGSKYVLKNYVYTSEVNDPMTFTAANVESVSSGEILALVPCSIALSAGQFGEYPMYCFTTDGIWSLVVNSTGGWSAAVPISRDVALSKNAILQMDQSIIFATSRGLMQISGSSIEYISQIFEGSEDEFFTKYADHMKAILNGTNCNISHSDDLFVPFKDFIADGNMSYDYAHQRIIISHPEHKFCFIFNMNDKVWTAEVLQISSTINSYPNAYAMSKVGADNMMIDFTKSEDDSASNLSMPTDGFILTRPLKLDNPDTMKTIRTVVTRGEFDRSHVSMIIYGSRNMTDWLLVGSCGGNRFVSHHGTPYKYFRVAIISKLAKNESISGLTIEFETKQTDKIR